MRSYVKSGAKFFPFTNSDLRWAHAAHHHITFPLPPALLRAELGMLSSIIYQNQSQATTLLDLPASIQNAQRLRGGEQAEAENQILSAQPPEQPYPSLEPKGLKRAKLLEGIPLAEQAYHGRIQAFISESLEEIKSVQGQRQWCRPRQTAMSTFEEIPRETSKSTESDVFSEPPIILSSISNVFSYLDDLKNRIVSNPFKLRTEIMVDRQACHIPPRSSFLLSDVTRFFPHANSSSNVFHRPFDFILMDPPWQNRSVRHAKTYQTSESRSEELFLHVLSVVLNHLTADGIVGIWVTNKASIRHLVLSRLYQKGFQLYQEWIWVKTTTSGEPVTPLDGLWRRPYEILLLFRRRREAQCRTTDASKLADISFWAAEVPVRIIVAVPDYHSRKPCLKEFIEPLLVDPTNYHALEIFARNLTAGWFSWGNETLKFNWDYHWARVKG
jgi:N6-adenosine-specific RNA methylase IME4